MIVIIRVTLMNVIIRVTLMNVIIGVTLMNVIICRIFRQKDLRNVPFFK